MEKPVPPSPEFDGPCTIAVYSPELVHLLVSLNGKLSYDFFPIRVLQSLFRFELPGQAREKVQKFIQKSGPADAADLTVGSITHGGKTWMCFHV